MCMDGTPPTLATLPSILLLSTFLSVFLFGVSFLQAYSYYTGKRQANDSPWLRFLPLWLILMQAVQQMLLCAAIYSVFVMSLPTTYPSSVSRYSVNNNTLTANSFFLPLLEDQLSDLFQAFLTLPAQMFFVYRIWRFGRSKLLIRNHIWIYLVFSIPSAVFQLVATVLVTAMNITNRDPYDLEEWNGLIYATAASAALLDITSAIAMALILTYEARLYPGTVHLIQRFVALTIHSGMAIAIAALLVFILRFPLCELQPPYAPLYAFFYHPLGAVYCICVLANLNLCDHYRGPGSDTSTIASMKFAPNDPPRPRGSMRSRTIFNDTPTHSATYSEGMGALDHIHSSTTIDHHHHSQP